MQIASVIAATVTSKMIGIRAIGWRWTGAIWAYNVIIYILLDPIKLGVRYALSGKAWNLVLDKKASKLLLTHNSTTKYLRTLFTSIYTAIRL